MTSVDIIQSDSSIIFSFNSTLVMQKARVELERFNADTTGKATIAGDVSPPCPSTDLEFCRGFHDAWSKTVIGELD